MSINNLKLLRSDILQLPCSNDDDYFPDFIENKLTKYQEHLINFEGRIGNEINVNFEKIKKLCSSINESIKLYYEGYPSKSFNVFKQGLDLVSENLFKQKRNVSISPKDNNFYRGRIMNDGIFSKSEMFHIPFEKRGLIKMQRYSIHGFPCLYLSDSIYTCWAELNKPPIEKVQFVRMELDYKFLQLSIGNYLLESLYELAVVKNEMDEDIFDDWVLNFLFTWPLSLACYVNVKDKLADFKPEYIVPQMLLEWIRLSEDLDGIKYYSAKGLAGKQKIASSNFNNYAIPVKLIENSGLCPRLKYDIKVSESITWQNVVENNKGIEEKVFRNNDLLERLSYHPKIHFLFDENSTNDREPYSDTIFGKIEYELHKYNVELIRQ